MRLRTRLIIAAAALLSLLATRSDADQPAAIDVPAPELLGGPWLNTPDNQPLRLADRRGEVTVVHFWTFGCINCRRNLPIYSRWQERFADRNVAILGVHTPETDGERDPDAVARRVKDLDITWPVLLDRDKVNWRRWGQRYWPTVYLLDKRVHVRFRWIGELEYQGAGGEEKMAARIEALLDE